MAKPVDFEGANTILRAPANMSPEQCLDLPIFRDDAEVYSCWRLSQAEIDNIVKTGVVWFMCQGHTHPPIKISGEALVNYDGREPVAEPYRTPAPKRAGQ